MSLNLYIQFYLSFKNDSKKKQKQTTTSKKRKLG